MPKGVYTRKPHVPKICEQCGCSFSILLCYAKRGQYRYCGRACYDTSRAPAPKVPRPTPEELFDAKVIVVDDCWEWTGYRLPNGYGQCGSGTRGRHEYAHRHAWIRANGPIPDGLSVLHHCDNPPCVRPDHLFLGTDADNHADKVSKGRQLKGEQIAGSRLTEAQAREIRQRFTGKRGEVIALAREYRVHQVTILDLVSGRTWRHLL